MPNEIPGIQLEAFKDIRYPHLYWVDDNEVAQATLSHHVEKEIPFGLEIGFGIQISRIHLIDNSINWLLTEPDRYFNIAKTRSALTDFQEPVLTNGHNIFALKALVDSNHVLAADIIYIRNIDYNDMAHLVPDKSDLKKGQRLVLLLNNFHVSELDKNKALLVNKGYDPEIFAIRDINSVIPLSADHFNKPEYLFDFTKG